MCRINFLVPAPQGGKTFSRVFKLMYGKPFGGAAAAAFTPFFMPGDISIQHKDVLDANSITTPHYGGNIVRIKNIFQHHCQVRLPAADYVF